MQQTQTCRGKQRQCDARAEACSRLRRHGLGHIRLTAYAAVWCIAAVTSLTACGPKASQGGFHSDNPAAKLYAIQQAVNQDQTEAIPDLVALLDHDDPVVRLWAIRALHSFTGQTMGYNPYDDRPQRLSAIESWLQYLNDQQAPMHAQSDHGSDAPVTQTHGNPGNTDG